MTVLMILVSSIPCPGLSFFIGKLEIQNSAFLEEMFYIRFKLGTVCINKILGTIYDTQLIFIKCLFFVNFKLLFVY